MKSALIFGWMTAAAVFAAMPAAAQSAWQAIERIETYSIRGQSGPELYASIGERGPVIGGDVRAIAHTGFKLTWRRDYQQRGASCVLASAVPKLIITYTLPKPANSLPPAVKQKWDRFYAGIQAHERVHGDFIKDLVHKIEAVSVGLTVADDPGCKRIRTELTSKLGELSRAERQQSRDFDRDEMSNGGNVHQLILALING